MNEGKAVKIRLARIDCPEKSQPFGKAAEKFTSDLVFGKTVTVQPTATDRYGRTVANVTVEGKSLNVELVRAGLAWWYRAYDKNDAELERLEAEARAGKKGLWQDANPTPPWDWRKDRKKVGVKK